MGFDFLSKKDQKKDRGDTWIFGTMLFLAALGLISAFVLSIEKLHLLENPDAILSCSFNLVVNCATVMQTPQASVFGFPNSYIGLMGYPIVITLAVAGLLGTRFPKKFMYLAQIGFGLGLIFAYWLFFQSVFVIEVLCPWCLLVTLATTIIFEALLRFNLRENNLYLSKNLLKMINNWLDKDYDKLFVGFWLLILTVVVLIKFSDGLFQ